MKKVIRAICYIAVMILLMLIGYSIGNSDKCGDWYQFGIEDVKKEMKIAVQEGRPFIFGDIKFIPRKDGAVNAAIAGIGDQGRRLVWAEDQAERKH
jgi:hypothetical protein